MYHLGFLTIEFYSYKTGMDGKWSL